MSCTVTWSDVQNARKIAKRKRASVACASCKISKARCSDYRPCARCKDHGTNCLDALQFDNRESSHRSNGGSTSDFGPAAWSQRQTLELTHQMFHPTPPGAVTFHAAFLEALPQAIIPVIPSNNFVHAINFLPPTSANTIHFDPGSVYRPQHHLNSDWRAFFGRSV